MLLCSVIGPNSHVSALNGNCNKVRIAMFQDLHILSNPCELNFHR